jgi:hypothetical protein
MAKSTASTPLQTRVLSVIERVEGGEYAAELDGKPLTPHRIAGLVEKQFPKDGKPSSGAVSAVLARWEEIGFAIVGSSPVHFRRLTAKGKRDGFDALRDAHRKASWEAVRIKRAAAAGKEPVDA